jgi:pimeloyl-ACP methyl ester carboxylesterase
MCNHTFWDRQLPLRTQFQVVRLDLRGHGDSSKPRGTYGLATMASDVRHLVHALGMRRCILVGWSMGGLVAQEALRLLQDRVVGLVLVDTTARALAAPDYPQGIGPDEERIYVETAESDFRAFGRLLASRLLHGEQTGLVQWATQQLLKTPAPVGQAALQSVLAADGRSSLSSIAVPTLVCHGRHDTIFPFAMGEFLHDRIPGSHLVAFENTGHAPMIEEPERFNAELARFADTLAGGERVQGAAARPAGAIPEPAAAAAEPPPAGAASETRPRPAKPPARRRTTAPKKPGSGGPKPPARRPTKKG